MASSEPFYIPGVRDNRNIQDKYRWWEHERIVEDLTASKSGFITVCMNLDGDFNLSSLLRSSNFFNTDSVWIVGNKRWDRRGAVGTQNYTKVEYRLNPVEAIQELKQNGFTVVAAEICEDSTPLQNFQFSEKTAVVFGEEQLGLSQEVLEACDAVVMIENRGSVRSLNVANAGSIFLWEYHKQHCFN